jgi:hypothetical protein
VALEATFRALPLSLHQLHEALNELEVTLGDKPPYDESALADDLESAVMDLMGTLHETRKAALNAQRALAPPHDLDRARRALTLCQERFHRLEKQFASGLVSYEKLKELARLSNERREWLPWANTVRQGIEQCRHPLERTSKALAACWEELAERLGMVSVSVQTIGQQIKMPAGAKTLETEPIT